MLVGKGVFAHEAPHLPAKLAPDPPPGLEYAARGFAQRYQARARSLSRHVVALALRDIGAATAARSGRASAVGERAALPLAQAVWGEGVRDLAAVKRLSSLPEPVTMRRLDIAYAETIGPSKGTA